MKIAGVNLGTTCNESWLPPSGSLFVAVVAGRMGRVTVFALSGCSHCERVKAFLDARRVPYAVIDLTTHPERLKDQRAITGSSSVPQVLFNGRVIGGADDVEALETELGAEGFMERVHEVLAAPDPTSPRLALDTAQEDASDAPSTTPRSESDEPPVATLGGVPFGFVGMIRELRSIVDVKDSAPRGLMRVVQRRCFSGRHLIDALLRKHPSKLGRDTAGAFAQLLCDCLVIREVGGSNPDAFIKFADDDSHLYRLQPDNSPGVLNPYRRAWVDPIDDDPNAVLRAFQQTWFRITKRHSEVGTGAVNYDAVRVDREFENLKHDMCVLRSVELSTMSDDQKLAFVINAYNLSVGCAFASFGAVRTRAHRSTFFDDVKLCLGGAGTTHVYSLNELEHGVLRGNRRVPYRMYRPFTAHDPRIDSEIKVDPRVHFALNCGAKSCPPVNSYTPAGIHDELQAAAQAFVEGNVAVDVATRTVTASALFKWYKRDFGETDADVLGAIAGWATGSAKTALGAMLGDGGGAVRLMYAPYDWTTNASASSSDYDVTKTKSEYSWLLGR